MQVLIRFVKWSKSMPFHEHMAKIRWISANRKKKKCSVLQQMNFRTSDVIVCVVLCRYTYMFLFTFQFYRLRDLQSAKSFKQKTQFIFRFSTKKILRVNVGFIYRVFCRRFWKRVYWELQYDLWKSPCVW